MTSGIYIRTERHNRNISKAHKGMKHSEETKRKISKNHAKYWKGKYFSKETRRKISEGLKGNKNALGKYWKWKLKLKWYQKILKFIIRIWRKCVRKLACSQ